MEIKDLSTNFIHNWFKNNRPEMNMTLIMAESFYEDIKDELLFAKENNDEELVIIFLKTFLENFYISDIHQVCVEVVEEDEFYDTSANLKKYGFFLEEIGKFINEVEKTSWIKKFEKEELLNNKEFRTRVRNFLREKGWNNLIEEHSKNLS